MSTPTTPQEVEGDESEMKCPTCGASLFDPADTHPSEGDVLECGSLGPAPDYARCPTKVRITIADWSLYLVGEVVQ
jgi:hypothetical protein